MMNKTLQWIISILFGVVLGIALSTIPYYLGVRHGEKKTFAKFAPHTDTLYLPKDTIIYEPVEVIKWKTRKDTVRLALIDTLYTTDSVLVEVPIEQKVYKDSLYRAVISGYNASLDTISIYQREKIITIHSMEKKYVDNKISVGLQVGYGVAGKEVVPYVGIGLSYNLFSPKRLKYR